MVLWRCAVDGCLQSEYSQLNLFIFFCNKMHVCVIGAGIIGLSTATCIQQAQPDIKVTLIADKITPNTLSDITAGFWKPLYLEDARKDLIRRWGDETFRKIEELWKENAKEYGVDMVSGYELHHQQIKPEDTFWRDTVYGFQHLSDKEIKHLGYSFKCGLHYTTYCLQPLKYLPHLLKQFRENGGIVIQKKLNSITEVVNEYDVIVNCCGLGSYHLVNDKESYPIRGQVFRVEAPFAKHFYIFGEDFYVLPNQNSVVLGGTHQAGDWDTKVRKEDSEKIWNNVISYLPCLKEAKILGECVGLRPGRKEIRLEAESLKVNGKEVMVVHNYGHGGSGITLHYGCAKDAARLAVEALEHKRKSKL